MKDGLDSDSLQEACGIFGAFCTDPERDAASLVYYGLFSLQHRGQESAGIAVANHSQIECRKGMGLVTDVFASESYSQLKGSAAIGHVRYSAQEDSAAENTQPFVSHFKLGSIAVAHNGSLTNADAVRELLEDTGTGFISTSDSEVIVNLIAKNYRKGLEKALTDAIKYIKGSYALAVLTEDAIIGARDPNGIRPLCFGRVDGGWVLASESCAISAVGGEFIRDIEPGEIIIINREQVLSFSFSEKTPRACCSFEYIYFARPDSVIDSIDVYESRIRAGEILGREAGVPADLVIGVPDSGVPAAIGYGRATGTPFGLGIVTSKYMGPALISTAKPALDDFGMVSYNVIKGEVQDKRVVVIDDSALQGTTSRHLAAMLREAGAREVHFRIASPPVRFPCYFGIDSPPQSEQSINSSNMDRLSALFGVDSLAFISIEGLLESLNGDSGYCLGCFIGEYPVSVPGAAK